MITHEKVGYTGYVASDDVLVNHDTAYAVTTAASVTMVTYRVMQDIDPHSKLRFKLELQNSGAGEYTYCRIYFDGVEVGAVSESGAAYVAKSMDIAMANVKRGSLITFVLRQYTAGTGHGKLAKICGKVSPVIEV